MIGTELSVESAGALAQAIVNTIREPFVVLSADLRVVVASRSFYETFNVDSQQTRGRLFFELGGRQWDTKALNTLLGTIIPQRSTVENFEIEHDFPGVGVRTMLLNARMVHGPADAPKMVLVAFHDITESRVASRALALVHQQTAELLSQKQLLLREMEHRIANSLQVIAAILLLKAKAVSSDESRVHLRDAHDRVMSVATLQSHLHATDGVEQVKVGPYISKLCDSLTKSMMGSGAAVLSVVADDGLIGSAEAVSLGLIVTELVINALKYAFPDPREDSKVVVTYESQGPEWRLTVSDNGIGKAQTPSPASAGGLGTAIVAALAKQLHAQMDTLEAGPGLTVTITRAVFTASAPLAA